MGLLLLACKSKKTNEQNATVEQENVVALERGFVEFYEQFHMDSMFQLDHVLFPLTNQTDEPVTEWNKENWIIHKPFNSFDNLYKREFEVFGTIVEETIIDANGFFKMVRRYAKISDKWQLIFYKVTSPKSAQ